MKRISGERRRQTWILFAWSGLLAAGLVWSLAAASPSEADLSVLLRDGIRVSEEPTVISPVGPSIVTNTNLLETVLEEGDILILNVVNEPILSMNPAEIARGGAIHHPLLGELKVVGKTLEQAERMIRQILAEDYLVDPRVSLLIQEYARYEFSVVGEVRQQGNFALPRNREIEVPQAIVLAGGPTRLGSTRATVERMEKGEQKSIRVDLRPGRGEPVKVRHGDTIRVGERWF
jgi:polysaccharide biosynthesis/export protein